MRIICWCTACVMLLFNNISYWTKECHLLRVDRTCHKSSAVNSISPNTIIITEALPSTLHPLHIYMYSALCNILYVCQLFCSATRTSRFDAVAIFSFTSHCLRLFPRIELLPSAPTVDGAHLDDDDIMTTLR